MSIHRVFDFLAALSAMAASALVYVLRIRGSGIDPSNKVTGVYLAALVAGATIGGYGFGTANLWLSGLHVVGRSILGALAGAIAAVELYKAIAGVRGSTGVLFVAAFATTVTVGRIGCLLSGLDDQTYGVPTGAAWGWDFGDHVPRHPVPLYESLAMAGFLAYALVSFGRRELFFLRNGFYLLVAFYAGQRFLWEFLKPYGTVVGPFNIFHLLCLALLVYGAVMIARGAARDLATA
jgi:phosphatidylglycerol---prolipoprotein diacylglyceryl transferase